MVLLTMTSAVVAAVNVYNEHAKGQSQDGEPDLAHPAVGQPISHAQLIDISRYLKEHRNLVETTHISAYRLSDLLKGCNIYIPPPPPQPSQSDSYKELMARLRKEEEARSYERMLQPTPVPETFAQRFPTAGANQGFLFPPLPPKQEDAEAADEMTYADINRQLALVANVLISIVACAICVWKAAWHWDVPARLALAMTSSIVVAVAEVAIYAGYIGRVSEAKSKERKKVERKTVQESWVVEPKKREKGVKAKDAEPVVMPASVEKVLAEGMRFRSPVGKG